MFRDYIFSLVIFLFSMTRTIVSNKNNNRQSCEKIAQVELGNGLMFYGGGFYPWNRYFLQGTQCIQFQVSPFYSFSNGVKITGKFDFVPISDSAKPAQMTFGIWDGAGRGVQFGPYSIPYSGIEFYQYYPYVPKIPARYIQWPEEIHYAPSNTSSLNISLWSIVNLNQYGRWTACIANGAWYERVVARYNLSVGIHSCPYSPTQYPTSQPSFNRNENIYWEQSITHSSDGLSANGTFLDTIPPTKYTLRYVSTDGTAVSRCATILTDLWSANLHPPVVEMFDPYFFRVRTPSQIHQGPNYVCSKDVTGFSVNFNETVYDVFLAINFAGSSSSLWFSSNFTIVQSSEAMGKECIVQNSSHTNHSGYLSFGLSSTCDEGSFGMILFPGILRSISANISGIASIYMRLAILDTLQSVRLKETPVPTSSPTSQSPSSLPTSHPSYDMSGYRIPGDDYRFFYNYPEKTPQNLCHGSLLFRDGLHGFSVNCVQYRTQSEFALLNSSLAALHSVINSTMIDSYFTCANGLDSHMSHKIAKVNSEESIDGLSTWIFQMNLKSTLQYTEDINRYGAFLFLKGANLGYNQTVRIVPASASLVLNADESLLNKSLCNTHLLSNVISYPCMPTNITMKHLAGAWSFVDISDILRCHLSNDMSPLMTFMLIAANTSSDPTSAMPHIPLSYSLWQTGNSNDGGPTIVTYLL